MADTKSSTLHEESEEQLVNIAQEAVSHCRWVVGECAAKWTQRYARGRTDADFAALIGLSGDQVYQRRRVWESFGRAKDEFKGLKWSHFYAALNWDDAQDCLHWAEEMAATVAEMRAWRRAQRGEDLTVDAEEESIQYLPTSPEYVQDPSTFDPSGPRSEPRSGGAGAGGERGAQLAVARQAGAGDDDNYTPYRADAASPPPKGGHPERSGNAAPPVSPEQLVRRMTSTLERCAKILTSDFRKEFRRLPAEVREKFLDAAAELQTQIAELK